MSVRLPSSPRVLNWAFAAVAVAFVLSTAVSEYNEIGIRRSALLITEATSPAVAHLSDMRGQLRRLILHIDDNVDAGVERGGRGTRQDWVTLEASMDAEWQAYRALRSIPGQRELWPPAERARAELTTSVAIIESHAHEGRWSEARQTLDDLAKPEADRLDAALLAVIQLNTRQGAALANRIDEMGRRSILLALGLDTISVLLTLLTALLVVRTVRRTTSLMEQRAEELELFAGRVAHDVLGPLGAASLALEVAAREAPPGSRTQRAAASGKAGLARARTIADGLLEFARSGARPQPGGRADVMQILRAVLEEVEPAAQARGITLEIEAVSPGEVACSPGILASVVSNLVRNAVKYVGEGPRRRVVVRARPLSGRVRIEVEDNGHGLPESLVASVFEPYVRGPGSREPGIGLGLATVKKVTEAHGGRVDVRSVPGLGCRFGVELPAPRPERAGAARTRSVRPLDKKDQDAVDQPRPGP